MGLIGPPELRKEEAPPPSPGSDESTFMGQMISRFNSRDLPARLETGQTENRSRTYLTTGDPCLDLFFHSVPGCDADSLNDRLHPSWAHDPLTTLKLVSHLRATKADRVSFFAAAYWLFQNHPQTLASNVSEMGSFKDLPEILYRVLEGVDVRHDQKSDRRRPHPSAMGFRRFKSKNNNKRDKKTVPREIRVSAAEARDKREKEAARAAREAKKIDMAKKLIGRYHLDVSFRFLYEKVSTLFADSLEADLERLASGGIVSSAARWCPSLDSSYDRSLLLCESIARKMFPRESSPEFDGIEEAHYAYRVRDRLQKQVLVPLRKALNLPEVLINAKQWSLIQYDKLSSDEIRFYRDNFLKRDGKRFVEYLKDVQAGKSDIASPDSLFVHEIIECLNDKDKGLVSELQWKRMVRDLTCSGSKKLKSCLAVCDVSSCMKGAAVEASIALGLLVSELSEDPWKGKIVTFDDDPQLHVIEGDDLRSKVDNLLRNLKWGSKGKDVQRVFDLILQVADSGDVKKEEMIKRVFVFSDMEFDKAWKSDWETDYSAIEKKFRDKGYGDLVPEIVFWKVRTSKATPVAAGQRRTALVSGFSMNMMRLFMDENVVVDPRSVMKLAISGEEYQRLVV